MSITSIQIILRSNCYTHMEISTLNIKDLDSPMTSYNILTAKNFSHHIFLSETDSKYDPHLNSAIITVFSATDSNIFLKVLDVHVERLLTHITIYFS